MISEKYKETVAKKGKLQWLNRESNVKNLIKSLKNNFGEIRGLKILDSGCAQGRDSAEIASSGAIVTGIDSDPKFVREAKNLYPTLKFDLGRIEDLPYKSAEFDAVYCVNTLFYTDPKRSLPELERVLKPLGILFITLDKSIIDLEKNKVMHTLDVNQALKIFKDLELISKTYFERQDEVPFKHRHLFYEIVLKKR